MDITAESCASHQDSHKATTLFIDIDGVLIEQTSHVAERFANNIPPKAIPGTVDKLLEWDRKGYKIILTTGRRPCWRSQTELELRQMGIFYDQLVMGVGVGKRIVINDTKPYKPDEPTAQAINLLRNEGISKIDI